MGNNTLSYEMASQIEIAETITKISSLAAGKVIVSGSHGGKLPGGLAVRASGRAVILNDAGCGLEDAGIGSLDLCQNFGIWQPNLGLSIVTLLVGPALSYVCSLRCF